MPFNTTKSRPNCCALHISAWADSCEQGRDGFDAMMDAIQRAAAAEQIAINLVPEVFAATGADRRLLRRELLAAIRNFRKRQALYRELKRRYWPRPAEMLEAA
jgi:hypothetical protein